MRIIIYNKQKDLPISVSSLKKMIPLLLGKLAVSTSEVIVHFVTKKQSGAIHEEFFQDPSPTDCMSFPIDPPGQDGILGEIFVCPKVAIEYALAHQKDPHEETTLYVIHALLHLLGFDDLTPQEKRKMRAMEKRCLTLIHPFSLKKPCLKTLF